MDISSTERKHFSERLQQALKNADYSPSSPTQLAREFNIRFDGHPVTVHAARKWLLGQAIPTQEKLRALAQWLGVSAEWLRYDGNNAPAGSEPANPAAPFDSEDLKLILDLQRLEEPYRMVAREIIRTLLRMTHRK
jgi:transcriptional regulator with XRE-family HTH domain